MKPVRRPEPEIEVEEAEVALVVVTEVVEEFEFQNASGDYRRTTTTREWLEVAEDDE